jgi:O-antigen ligase
MTILIPAEEPTTALLRGRTLIWLLGILVSFSWFIHYILRKRKIQISKRTTLYALLFIIWGTFSIIWSQDKTATWQYSKTLLELFVFFILLQSMINSESRLQILIKTYIISSVLIALLVIFSTFSAGLSRATLAENQNPNALARALSIALLMSLNSLRDISKAKVERILIFLGTIILGLAIFLTGSRGAWLALFAAISFTSLLIRVKLLNLRTIIIWSIILIILLVTLSYRSVLNERLLMRAFTTFKIEENLSGVARINIWLVGWEMIKDNPIIGVGLWNFPIRFEEYMKIETPFRNVELLPGRDPHNIYLGILAELGIIGLIMFLNFLLSIFQSLYVKRQNEMAITGILILSFILFSGIVEPILYRKYFWFVLGLATTIPMVVCNEKN